MAQSSISTKNLFKSPAITTALIPVIGYNKASELAKMMRRNNVDVIKANEELKILSSEKIKKLLNPDNLLKNGFSLNDII